MFVYLPGDSPHTGENDIYSGQTRTITTGSSGQIVIGYRAYSGTITRDDYWYQIEQGSTATSYVPYTGGDGHSITLYALDIPTTSVTLKINYKEVA